MPQGIILKGIGGFYYVSVEGHIFECKARGIFRKDGIIPLPGDIVQITVTDENESKGIIESIEPRKSELVRPAVANINQVIIVVSAKCPNPDLLLLDKLLVTAARKYIEVIICINKIDLDETGETQKIIEVYKGAGYKVLVTSSKLDDNGIQSLSEELVGKISVFSGQSGVGKSTLLNNVFDKYVMPTGNVSIKIERGRHTTRHAELVLLKCGGYLVDTPGFSSFELEDIKYEDLQEYYIEFYKYIDQCKFHPCSHINEPSCAVKAAKEAGIISEERYLRYCQLYTMLKDMKIDYKSISKKGKK